MGTLSDVLLWIPALTSFVIGALFTPLAWFARRRGGRAGLLALWIACAIPLGSLWGLLVCARGLTCDGGGSLAYYLSRGTAVYGFMWICAFGLIALLVSWRRRRDPAGGLLVRHIFAGGAAAVIGMVLAGAIIVGVGELTWKLTCESRTYRPDDGSVVSACDL